MRMQSEGVAAAISVLSIAAIVAAALVIGVQVTPRPCERIAAVIAIAGDCR